MIRVVSQIDFGKKLEAALHCIMGNKVALGDYNPKTKDYSEFQIMDRFFFCFFSSILTGFSFIGHQLGRLGITCVIRQF